MKYIQDFETFLKESENVANFYKNYINLDLRDYSRYWALFAFMYDYFEDVKDSNNINNIYKKLYKKFKNKGVKYTDALRYFASFRKQELAGKTAGTLIKENLDFQIKLRDKYINSKLNDKKSEKI